MKNINLQSTSLILCTTPLQVLIAESIIDKHQDQSFDVIMITFHDNEKYKYYFNRIKSKCNLSLYYVKSDYFLANKIRKVIRLHSNFTKVLRKNKIGYQYSNIYLASIDEPYFQYIITKCNQSLVYTFDDGTANIVEDDIYCRSTNPLSFKRVAWRLSGIKNDIDDIKELSQSHFTIYENIPNIIHKTECIKLFEDSSSFSSENKDVSVKAIKFYLGQPLLEISKDLESVNLNKIIEVLDIDYYYPHPRESLTLSKYSDKIIYSPLIFEDFLIQYLKDHPNTNVEIYSFLSSAALNLANIDRVNCKFIYNPLIYKKYKKFYSLANEKFNIPLIKLD